MFKHLYPSFLYLGLFCLLALLSSPALSVADREDDYLKLKYPLLIKSLYQNQGSTHFWLNYSLRDELQRQIVPLAFAALNEDLFYSLQALKKAERQKNWRRYERLASDLLLFYLAYQEQLATQGEEWLFGKGIANNIGPPSQEAIAAFFDAPSSQAQLAYLQRLAPKTVQYAHLYKNLWEFYRNKKPTAATFTAFAKFGEPLEQKGRLLARLQLSGDISAKMKSYLQSEDKKRYSRQLEEVIIAFQNRHGLKADGIIGKNTRYWLNLPHQERLRLMALNLLRIQFWSAQLQAGKRSRLVLVNIPDYTMEYWEAGERVFASKVIVGRTDRKTPLFTAKLDSIVFHPEWRVPTSIMRQDLLPEILANRHFLAQQGYQIVSDWHSKKVIDPASINWRSLTAENFPYKLRQRPGKKNALGLYKFNTPNRYAIYLHDTPAKHLFKRQQRTYSSGCIRVEQASEFVQLLMDRSGFTYQDYRRHREQQKTAVVNLSRIIPVYTIYQTAWVDQRGVTQFRGDIYHYDSAMHSQSAGKNYYFLLQEE